MIKKKLSSKTAQERKVSRQHGGRGLGHDGNDGRQYRARCGHAQHHAGDAELSLELVRTLC